MEKRVWYIVTLILLVMTALIVNNCNGREISEIERKHKIEMSKLEKISETQYRKLVADTLTKRQMQRVIDSLKIESVKAPKIVLVPTIEFREQEKKVDTLYLPTEDSKLYVSDYYPNKEQPFVNYTLRDDIGKFKFYPLDIALVVSENKDGTWQVDTKMPEYINITNITALGLPQNKEKAHSPFYIGGGIQKQGERYPISVLGGFRVKRTIIFGGLNTEGQVEIKTLYNL